MQGKVLFSGKAGPNGAWTEEEDQLAQMIELFGYLPSDLLSQGKHTQRYFTDEGIYVRPSLCTDCGNNVIKVVCYILETSFT